MSQCSATFRFANSTSDLCCTLQEGDDRAHGHSRIHSSYDEFSWVGPPSSRCQWTTARGGTAGRNGIDFHCLEERTHKGPHKIGTGEYLPNWSDRNTGARMPKWCAACQMKAEMMCAKGDHL